MNHSEQRDRRQGFSGASRALKSNSLMLEIYRKNPLLQSIYRPLRVVFSRYALKRRLVANLRTFSPCRVIIGANGKPRGDWIMTEIYNLNILQQGDWERYFKENSIDALLAEHVWEHLSPDEGLLAARFCYRFLKPNGYLRVAVPDGHFPSNAYLEFVRPGGNGPSATDHKVLYTHKTFTDLFRSAGFQVDLLEYWDESSELHISEWDPADGMIERSFRHSKRVFQCDNGDEHKYTSIILDARK